MKKLLVLKHAVFLSAALLVFPAAAEMNVDGAIKYRQSVMGALGGHTGAASRIIRGHVPMKDQLVMHAAAIADIAKTIDSLFPVETYPPESTFAGATVNTNALEAIAEQQDKFRKAVKDNVQAAAAFLKVVKAGDDKAIGEAFKKLGETCKGCHKPFRKKQEQ